MPKEFAYAFVAAALLLAGVGLAPLRLRLAVRADARRRRWRLRLCLAPIWGWPRVVWRWEGRPHGEEGGGSERRGGVRAEDAARAALAVARRLARAVRVEGARLSLEVGAGEAAPTAVAAGCAWSLGSVALAVLGVPAGRARLSVRPRYGELALGVRGAIALRLSLGQAALCALPLATPVGRPTTPAAGGARRPPSPPPPPPPPARAPR
ncbi:MAG: hypothetical protein K6V73_05225 [Firmicutes bacterium]|nr:hypothetical protein [Bacillota bacterium]